MRRVILPPQSQQHQSATSPCEPAARICLGRSFATISYLVVNGTTLLDGIADAAGNGCASFSARYRFKLLVDNRVVAELGSAHEGSRCTRFHVKHTAVHSLVDEAACFGRRDY